MNSSSGRSAFVVGAGILVSRIVGLLRQTAFAHYFGSTGEADAINVALKIPNGVRNILGEGTLAAAFVPVYSRLLDKADERTSRAMANAVLGLLFATVSVLTIVGIAIAPWLTQLLAGGLDAQQLTLATTLTRVIFPMSALMVLSGWCLGVQNSHRRFFWSYASAAMWSVAQIVLLVGWGPRAESLAQLAWWLAWATLAGSALQVAVQLPEVWRLIGAPRPLFSRRPEGVDTFLRNVVPVVIAVGVVQISSFVDQRIASHLPEGAITNLQYASLIALLPVALFGVSVASSALPDLSRDSGREAVDALVERIRSGWQRILFYIVPSALALVAFGDYCNGIVYHGGKFGIGNQRIVHVVLAGYAIGLVSFASVRLMASAFYALQDYRTPLRASMTSLVVSGVVAFSLAWPFRESPFAAGAVALGSALGSYTNLLVLLSRLRARVGALYTREMWRGTLRIVVSGAAALAVSLPIRLVADPGQPRLFGPPMLLAFGVTYLVCAWLLGSREAARLLRRPARGG